MIVRQRLIKILDQLLVEPVNNIVAEKTTMQQEAKTELLQILTDSQDKLLQLLQQNHLLSLRIDSDKES